MVGLLGMDFLVGDNADREAANAPVAAYQRLSVFRLVFVKFAAIEHARQNFLHVVGAGGRRIVNAVNFFGRERRFDRLFAIPWRLPPVSPFIDDRTDAGKASGIVGLAEVDRAADRRMHGRSSQLFCGNFLPDRRLHQRRPGEE